MAIVRVSVVRVSVVHVGLLWIDDRREWQGEQKDDYLDDFQDGGLGTLALWSHLRTQLYRGVYDLSNQ